MIERLEQLTVGQFVDLVCGDTSVLTSKREVANEAALIVAMRNIVFEYKEIVDKAGISSYLSTVEELVKAKMSIVVFQMCQNLVLLNEHDRAREVLVEYGINANSMNDQRVTAEIKSRLERAKSTIERIENESKNDKPGSINIRRIFDTQTAMLMAHFKFQIDTSTMKATVYAHLVDQHNREVKAMRAAFNKK